MNLDFVFKSPDHLRYENGKHVSGPHGGAGRAIKVQPNISGEEGYTVTVYNLDGNHPMWQNNVQMAPKQMKLIQKDGNKIILRGYGQDAMGGSFSDYGLTIHFLNDQISKCILHMHDKNADIEYIKGEDNLKVESEIVSLAKKANAQYHNENVTDGKELLIKIFTIVKSSPNQLQNLKDYSSVGTSFLLMLDENLTDDIDTLQMMVSISYLCISKAIEKDNSNINLYKDRLLLLRLGHDPLKYTVMLALNLNAGMMGLSSGMTDFKARDAIYKMEIFDLELNPILSEEVPFFHERKVEFDEKISRQFFMPEKTKDKVLESGLNIHKRLFEYLVKRILVDEDVDF